MKYQQLMVFIQSEQKEQELKYKEQESGTNLFICVHEKIRILQDFNSHYPIGLQVQTFVHFSERTFSNKLQDGVIRGAAEQSLTNTDVRVPQLDCGQKIIQVYLFYHLNYIQIKSHVFIN